MTADGIELRPANVADGARIWQSIADIGDLERNSCYAYLLLCSHFAGTCVVAERGADLLGFVVAYRPPSDPDDVFVWQVGVSPQARGRGLGRRLLEALLLLPAARGAEFLTATVSPDNWPSTALFRGFARDRGFHCEVEAGFSSASFAEPHPDEKLFRIGPLRTSQ